MTTSSISVRLQRHISTPSTTHADWRTTTNSPQISLSPQILELAVDNQTSTYPISDVSNLSAGGELEDITGKIHQRRRDLCITVTMQMGLTFCGVDFACTNIEDINADYSIFELNGSPGLDNYVASSNDRLQKVRTLYKRIFEVESFPPPSKLF